MATLLQALAPAPPPAAALLAHPLLSGAPSSAELHAAIVELEQATLPANRAALDAARRALLAELAAQQEQSRAHSAALAELPAQLEAAEDALLELCTELGLDDAPAGDADAEAGLSRSTPAPDAPLQQLLRQRDDVAEASAARLYLTLLARADELRDAVLVPGKSTKARLEALRTLCALLADARAACAADEEELETIAPAAAQYLVDQRDAAFSGLRTELEDGLKTALDQAGWPPAPAEVAEARGEVTRTGAEVLAAPPVREAWLRLCRLQRVAVRARLVPPPSYEASSEEPAGAVSYAPLFATQVLCAPLLARFAYHFDGNKSTNRLDKPQWALAHMSSLLRLHSALFTPRGAVFELFSAGGYAGVGPRELVNALLVPLRVKTQAARQVLQASPAILAHTVGALLAFDDELRGLVPSLGPAERLADTLLNDAPTFDAWLEGERSEATEQLEEILSSPDAWAIGPADTDGDDEPQTWEAAALQARTAGVQTTHSARGICTLQAALAERAAPLRSLPQRIGFLAIQDELLRTYAGRLSRSLDAFESLSSAFARALPGGMGSDTGEADMVRGLRGSSRLLKALLSASFIEAHLERAGTEGSAVQLGADLSLQTPEAQRARETRNAWRSEREDREVDGASLGELVRRGMRTGVSLRPLGGGHATAAPAAKTAASEEDADVWREAKVRFGELAARASRGLERLVISETTEAMRDYSMRCVRRSSTLTLTDTLCRHWDASAPSRQVSVEPDATEDSSGADGSPDEDDPSDVPTPSLIPSLSLLSSHLLHLVPVLQPVQCLPIYRAIATAIAGAVVERVVMSGASPGPVARWSSAHTPLPGGAHRFDAQGARRFEQDYTSGWLAVVREVSASATQAASATGSRLPGVGRRPEAPWQRLRDAVVLLSLPTSTAGATASHAAAAAATAERLGLSEAARGVTLSQATRALFDEPDDDARGWPALRATLDVSEALELRVARELVRRRVECFR
jgi:hypothetical protein